MLFAQFGILNYTILITYLACMFAIGLKQAGKQETTEDYFLAGRKMPWLVVALSMFASLASATSYLGLPGRAYDEDCSIIMWGVASIVATPLIVTLFYPIYHRLQVTTSFEYIGLRFGRPARVVIALLLFLARLGWLGVVIYSPALAISVATGLNLYAGIFLMGILALVYTVAGGMAAVLWTDLLQFCVLAGGALWVAGTLIADVPGGFGEIVTHARETGHLINWNVSLFQMSGTVVLFAYFFNVMQDYGADQVTVQRMMTIESLSGKVKAALLNSLLDLSIFGLLLFLGIGMLAYYHHHPELLPEDIHGDRMLPFHIMHALPNGVSGLLITALFAAAMSSMDSGINSLATIVVHDFIRPFRKQQRPPIYDVRLAQGVSVVIGLMAIVAACYAATIEHVLKAAITFLGMFSGPILALFLMGLLTRWANFYAWCIGTIASLALLVWIQNYVDPETGLSIHWTWYFPSAFGTSFLVGIVLSPFCNALSPQEPPPSI